jgi:serine/threonine-protein kinase
VDADDPTRRPGDTPDEIRTSGPHEAVDAEQRFGKYVRGRLLGQGGMGAVYLAHDTELRRKVALKFLLGGTPEDVERFLREARLAANLRHPGIAAVYDVQRSPQPHIAMEYIDGRTADRVKPLPLRRALEIVRDAATAVHHAHAQNVIHRDLKPSNLMVDAQGRVFVMDFGLARSTQASSRLSASGSLVGTPAYMPPEQAQGRSDIDARADVYALGATLYHLVTGRPPFEGDAMIDVVVRVVTEEPPTPRSVNRAVPPDVETIILKAMDKERDRRYRSAATFADDIRRVLEGEPISARPASLVYRIRKRLTKNRAAAALAAVMLVVLAAGAVLLVALTRRHRTEATDLERTLATANAFWAAELRLRDSIAWAEDEGDVAPDSTIAARRAAFEQAAAAVDAEHPGNAITPCYRAWMLCLTRGEDEGRSAFERAVTNTPDPAIPRLWRARWLATSFLRTLELGGAFEETSGRTRMRVQSTPAPGQKEALAALQEDVRVAAGAAIWTRLREGRRLGDLARALSEFTDGRYAEAEPLLADLSSDLVCGRDARRLLGVCRYLREDYAGAAAAFESLVTEHPRSHAMLILAGASRFGEAVASEDAPAGIQLAIDLMSRAVDAFPQLVRPLLARGLYRRHLAHQMARRREDSREVLRAACGDFARALSAGRIVDASHMLNAVRTASTAPPDAGLALMRAIVEACDRALAERPGDSQYLKARGMARRMLAVREHRAELLTEAVADLTPAAEREGNAEAFLERARCRRDAGDPEGATRDVEESLLRRPGDLNALALRFDLLVDAAEADRSRGRDARVALARAATEAEELIRLDPEGSMGWRGLARVLHARALWTQDQGDDPSGDYRRAIEAASRAVEIAPRDFQCAGQRANLRRDRVLWRLRRGDAPEEELAEAFADLDRAADAGREFAAPFTSRAEFHYGLARHAVSRGRDPSDHLKRALADYAKALEISPTDGPALTGRPAVLLELGGVEQSRGRDPAPYWSEALECYAAQLRVAPSADPLMNRAYVRRLFAEREKDPRGLLRQAIEDLEQALKLAPRHFTGMEMLAEAWQELAEAELRRGGVPQKEHDRAVHAATDLIVAYPKVPKAWRQRADTYRSVARGFEHLGQDGREMLAAAIEDLDRAHALVPRDRVTLVMRGAMHFERARLELRRGGDARPSFERAAADYRALVALEPDVWSHHHDLGVTLEDLGDVKGAIAALERALALKSDDADSRERLERLRKK